MHKIVMILISLMALVLLIGCTSRPAPTGEVTQLPPVKISPTGFTVDGKPFRFIGSNSIDFGFYDRYNLSIEEAFRTAKENGISVIRIYLWSGKQVWGGAPGPLNWGPWGVTLRDYDKVIDIAGKYGIYVIATLTDCNAAWSSEWFEPDLEKYFKEKPHCDCVSESGVESFKKYIEGILTRKNTVNGKIYRDDTTIFAWDIANELSIASHFYEYNYDTSDVYNWLDEIVKYTKELDPNHLVTIGVDSAEDDFYNAYGPYYEMWNVPGLDFFSFHLYLFNERWKEQIQSEKHMDRMKLRTKIFLSMGKPVVLEEFDFSPIGQLNYEIRTNETTKQLYYEEFKKGMDTALANGASGVMFFGWNVPEAKNVPKWWALEVHDATEKELITLIRDLITEYQLSVPTSHTEILNTAK